jgi:hypothetical protein
MKRIFLLFIPFLLPAIALSLWLFYDKQQPPAWQMELDKYTAYQERSAPVRITQQTVDRARKPWKFMRDSGFLVYGDTPYYVTDNTYNLGRVGGFNRMPLPYPPEELWCVLLRLEPIYAPVSPRLQMVFVARHQDLYNAGWVIHAAIQPADSAELAQTIARVGCDIEVAKPMKNFKAELKGKTT